MSFPRALPERAFEAHTIRSESLIEQNEILRENLKMLLREIRAKHRYQSALIWDLALTVACNKAEKVLK